MISTINCVRCPLSLTQSCRHLTPSRLACLAAFVVAIHACSPHARSAIVTLSGSFDASGFSTAITPDPFGGDFTFSYDDTTVGPFTNLIEPVTTLTLDDPVIGTTPYSTANTSIQIVFNATGTAPLLLTVGGTINGVGNVATGTDDFSVGWGSDLSAAPSIGIGNVGVANGSPSITSGSVVTTIIPEPSSLLLAILIIVTLGAYGKRM